MKVLKAIGNFFVKIWRWIKNTAWIQPLLIVGAIFAIIFSIPSITSWIQGMADDSNSAATFYGNYKKSLAGGASSDADKVINDIMNRQNNPEEASSYPDKYFLAFVSKTCPSCEEARPGFETLKNNWNGSLAPKDTSYNFNMITIFTDETTDETTAQSTAFQQFLDRNSYFFEESAGVGRDSNYYLNGKLSDSDLGNLEAADPDDFLTPTIIMIDFTMGGISEVMFGVTGDNDYAKASLLQHCWDHSEEFSSNYVS